MPVRIAIIGAGGFAREVSWLINEINGAQAIPAYNFEGFLVSDLTRLGPHDSLELVLGDYSWLEQNTGALDALAIGIGTPAARLRVGEELSRRFPELQWPALVHPGARFDERSCVIGRGAILCAGVIATVGVEVAEWAAINLACTIGHEARIGRGCVLNPAVNISGGVELGDGVLVGTGAQVLQYLQVGDGATIGAGAVVTKAVAEGATVVGMPAKARGA